jgi:Zn-dependent metalloprotease
MCQKGHRHSIFCILPPHILREVAKNSDDKEQREQALNTLGLDQTSRTNRINQQFMSVNVVRPLMAAAPAAQRSIFTANHDTDLPGKLVRAEGGAASHDVEVDEAYDGLGATFDFYLQIMHRDSIDGQGLPLNATVHYDNAYDNAFWNGDQMVFGDGDGKLFNRFTISLDVIGHELTHGVTGSTAKLVYMGQPGALNESISDVFGSMIKQYKKNEDADKADWLIGEGLLTKKVKGKALRSMKEPGTAYDDPVLGKDPQPDRMSKFVNTKSDNGGVHINSGIPNRAFYLVASALKGKSWEKAGQIWYSTLRDSNLRTTATFTDFAKLTVINAGHLYGSASVEAKAVTEAWQTVGVSIKPITRGAGG